jgi:thiamine kinase-like enzyme
MSNTITHDYLKGKIKNELYDTFHNLLKSKGYYLLHGDISPTNFVFKKKSNGNYTFKLIDFDRIIVTDIKDAYHGEESLKIDTLIRKLKL